MNKAFEKILERLDKCFRHDRECDYVDGLNTAYCHAKTIVREVAEEYNGGWIPCSERLPDVEADVLLSLRSLDICTGFRANTDGCFYIDGDTYVEYENVIAWQKLPEPYQLNGE